MSSGSRAEVSIEAYASWFTPNCYPLQSLLSKQKKLDEWPVAQRSQEVTFDLCHDWKGY